METINRLSKQAKRTLSCGLLGFITGIALNVFLFYPYDIFDNSEDMLFIRFGIALIVIITTMIGAFVGLEI